jgi:hypothetical protein
MSCGALSIANSESKEKCKESTAKLGVPLQGFIEETSRLVNESR